jgi:hypothetical protein
MHSVIIICDYIWQSFLSDLKNGKALKSTRYNDPGSTGSPKIEIAMFFGEVSRLNMSKVNFIMKVIE